MMSGSTYELNIIRRIAYRFSVVSDGGAMSSLLGTRVNSFDQKDKWSKGQVSLTYLSRLDLLVLHLVCMLSCQVSIQIRCVGTLYS